jgi:hypothetical protein
MKALDTLGVRNGRKVAAAITGIPAAASKVRVVPALLAALLLAAGGMALSASSAEAAPATAYVTLVFPNGSSYPYPCAEGHTYHTDLPSKVARVESDCGVRVWLHQNNNNTGKVECYKPYYSGDDKTGETVTWVNLYISNNNQSC